MFTSALFGDAGNGTVSGVAYKNLLLKKTVLGFLLKEPAVTLTDLSRRLSLSITKVNDLMIELQNEGLIQDNGKTNSGVVGRRPTAFGLHPDACYFIGVEVKNQYVNIGLMNFTQEMTSVQEKIPFELANTQASLDSLLQIITDFIGSPPVKQTKIQGVGVNVGGRINHQTGSSYNFFNFMNEPLADVIKQKTGLFTYVENDSRAMAFGEYRKGVAQGEKDVLFINMDLGIGLGMHFDGKIYHGKSGFAGEFGHIPLFDNEIICHCGKKGCLETEASGYALRELFVSKLKSGASSLVTKQISDFDSLTLDNIIEATKREDMLAIELVAQVGEKLGKGVALLINLFNPELIVLGGSLSLTGNFILLPVQSATNKYSLGIINHDTKIKLSTLGERAGVIGACLLVMNRLISAT